jgi:hypothetical protein
MKFGVTVYIDGEKKLRIPAGKSHKITCKEGSEMIMIGD